MDAEITAQTTEGLECGKNPLQTILDAVQLMAEQMNAFQKSLLEDRAASALRITNLEASVNQVVLTQRAAKRATPYNKPGTDCKLSTGNNPLSQDEAAH